MYWPSFNGGGSEGDEQHRAYINTYLSLCACTVITFAITALTDKKGKFTMVTFIYYGNIHNNNISPLFGDILGWCVWLVMEIFSMVICKYQHKYYGFIFGSNDNFYVLIYAQPVYYWQYCYLTNKQIRAFNSSPQRIFVWT
jgi:hypothetical protein